MEQNEIKIRVAEEKVTDRALRRRRTGFPWLLCVGVLAAVGIAATLLMRSGDEPPAKSAAAVQVVPETVDDTGGSAPESVTRRSNAANDDGQSLWMSPTAGEPLELSYLLPGTQMILHVRMAELLSHAEGEKVFAALGPWCQQRIQELSKSSGIALSEVETLLLGLRPQRTGPLEYALCFRTTRSLSHEELGENCFLPAETDGTVLVNCSPSARIELQEQGAESPLFARELQRVLQRTDASRVATLVFAGKFLQISGEKLVQGTGEPLREVLVDFLGDEATATALSAHWGENFFLELQSTVALNERPHRFAALLEERIADASDQVEDAILAEPLHPYGRKVIARLPAMLRKLGNYTRSAEEEGLSVVRTYLPITAGHNLLMATELLLNTAPSRDVAARGNPRGTSAAKSPAIEDRLQQRTSLVFTKETLQKSLEMLSEDLQVPVEIAGRDLQLEGITKNQSFGIDMRDQPAAEILLAVMLRANPDRTARGPSDVKQKLVYVIRPSVADQTSVIVVTTRSAAQHRGEKLPAVFVSPAQ